MDAATLGTGLSKTLWLEVKQRLAIILLLVIGLTATAPAFSMPRYAAPLFSSQVGLAWYMVAFELGPWEQYLIHELTPDLERLSPRELPHISWLHLDEAMILPEFARSLIGGAERASLAMSMRQFRSSLLVPGLPSGGNPGELRVFEQAMVMPGLTRRLSDRSAMTVSAVLASQRYGAAEMNLQTADRPLDFMLDYTGYDPYRTEVSHGTGLRFAFNSELTAGVRLEAAFQSRINMDEFASLRGLHGIGAELDIPPRIQLGLELSTGDRSHFNFGVAQIFYSDVSAFPSRALPARFTALLGDRNSPQFNWGDLTVYSLGWHWNIDSDVEVFLDYRTRTQPRPTDPGLAAALNSELASNAFLAGVSKGVGKFSRIHLNAAYAPPEFAFGGHVLGVVSDKFDQGLEVQAMLSMSF